MHSAAFALHPWHESTYSGRTLRFQVSTKRQEELFVQ